MDPQQSNGEVGGGIGGGGLTSWITQNPVASAVKKAGSATVKAGKATTGAAISGVQQVGKATTQVGKATVKAGKATTGAAISSVQKLGTATLNASKVTADAVARPAKWVAGLGHSHEDAIHQEDQTAGPAAVGGDAVKDDESSDFLSAAADAIAAPIHWVSELVDDDADDDDCGQDHQAARGEVTEMTLSNENNPDNGTSLDKRTDDGELLITTEMPKESLDEQGNSMLSTITSAVQTVTKPVSHGAGMVVKGTGRVLNAAADAAHVVTDPVLQGAEAMRTFLVQKEDQDTVADNARRQDETAQGEIARTEVVSRSKSESEEANEEVERDSSLLSAIGSTVQTVTKPVVHGAGLMVNPIVKGTGRVLNAAADAAQVVTDPVVQGTGAVVQVGSRAVQVASKPLVQGTGLVVQGTGAVLNAALGAAQVVTEPVVTGTGAALGAAWKGVGTITGLGERDGDYESEKQDSLIEPEGDPALPLDEHLKQMELILSKQLKNISVKQWHDVCWSEKDSFYAPWLAIDNEGVMVGDWQTTEDEKAPIVNDFWDKETYDRKRIVSFEFDSSVFHAKVKQTQYLRLQGDDRCVLAVVNETSGVPFADSFNVQVRWVATRVGQSDLSIKVGLFIVFVKQTIVAGKIRSATMDEAPSAQRNLYDEMKKVLGAEEGGSGSQSNTDETELDKQKKEQIPFWQQLFPFLRPPQKNMDDIDSELMEIETKLRSVKLVPMASTPDAREQGVEQTLSDFRTIDAAIDTTLLHLMGHGQHSTPPKSTEVTLPAHVSAGSNRSSRFSTGSSRSFRPVRSLTSGIGAVVDWLDPRESVVEQVPGFDQTLAGMDVELDKVLNGTSPEVLLKKCLDPGSLYESWLKDTGKTIVRMELWSKPPVGDIAGFVDPWNGEKYDRKRQLSFSYQRSTFLLHGSKNVNCDITQYYRLDNNGKKIVWASTTVVQDGVIESSFSVHSRWVIEAMESDPTSISVKAGVFVLMVRPSVLEGKIRAGTTQEFSLAANNFYACFKDVLSSSALTQSAIIDVNEAVLDEPKSLNETFQSCVSVCQPMWQRNMVDDEEVSKQIKRVDRKLHALKAYLGESQDRLHDPAMNSVLSQLVVVRETLDSLIEWHQSTGKRAIGATRTTASKELASMTSSGRPRL